MKMSRCFAFALLVLGLTGSATAQTVSFTFDDGPTLHDTPLMTPTERNEALVRQLAENSIHAMFFVTLNNGANRPEGRALLKRLSDQGHLLANHGVTHLDFNAEATTLERFTEEILSCDVVIRTLPGYRKFFRFPYLREGSGTAKRDGVRRFLREHDYRLGYVSIDTSDYLFDQKLRLALQRNPRLDLTPWRELYLASLWSNVQSYEQLARQLYEREVKHVLLLHHNLANALFLGDVIAMFRTHGWNIGSPDVAFEDSAYQVAPMLPVVNGSVLETTAQALGVSMKAAFVGGWSESRLAAEADKLSAIR